MYLSIHSKERFEVFYIMKENRNYIEGIFLFLCIICSIAFLVLVLEKKVIAAVIILIPIIAMAYLRSKSRNSEEWKQELKRLKKQGKLHKNDRIEVSFKYIYKIKKDDAYLFSVDSEGRYKLVEEYYEYNENEKSFYRKIFHYQKI